jgi:Holliday junction resolvasome RuvABC endonuclease subunit
VYVLGLDPSPLRLGWAFARISDARPGVCGMYPLLDKKRIVPLEEVVRIAIMNLPVVGEVSLIGVEEMYVGPNKKQALALEYTAGQVAQAASRVWPEARVIRIPIRRWKVSFAGLKLTADKDEQVAKAIEFGFIPPNHDAADAALIALTALGIQKEIEASL